jgi:phosphoribosylformylglycinamidine synthase
LVTSAYTKNDIIKIPIAHGEGRYFADETTIQSLVDSDQILFKYCDMKGEMTPESNPNGASHHIAGITNIKRNVFGMMPHPERAADENLNNTDGKKLFESILQKVLA